MRTSSGFNQDRKIGSLVKPEPMFADFTWWIGLDRPQFYATVADRQPTLKARYGSAVIATLGEIQPGITERKRNARENDRDRRERAYA